MGLFHRELSYDDKRCIKYSDDYINDMETVHRVARAFGVLAPIFSGIALLGFLFITLFLKNCPTATPKIWVICRVILAPSFLFQALTFTIFGMDQCVDPGYSDEDSCHLGAGGGESIVATFFLLVATVMSWLAPAPQNPMYLVTRFPQNESNLGAQTAPFSPASAEDKVTMAAEPDGTKRTIIESVSADGTKVITDNIDKPQTPSDANLASSP